MPAEINHPILGTLTFGDFDNWETQVELCTGHIIDLSLTTRMDQDPNANIDRLLQRGVEMLQWAQRNENVCREAITDELLELYNDTWAPEGAKVPISREEFLQRITPTSLRLDVDWSSGYFYWADDDMFAGHWIEIRFGKDWRITEINLAG